MKKTLIAVYGIYKNEENFIKRFLNSVRDADEIVLCDTGSTDKTNDIINEFMKNNTDINIKIFSIYVSPWRFDDARNTALSLVSPDMDICISVDMDEYLSENWKNSLLNQYDPSVTRYYHKFKTFWENGNVSEHLHDRIHVRNKYMWKLPVHEILEYDGTENVKMLSDFYIYHTPKEKSTREGYLALLKQSVKEQKDLWKSWSFLAGEYLNLGDCDEALNALDTALNVRDCDKCFLYKQKYYVYKFLGEIDKALFCLDNSIFYMPERRELYYEKAKFLSEIGRNTEALFTILEAEKKKDKIIDYYYEGSAWGKQFSEFKQTIYNLAKKDGLKI